MNVATLLQWLDSRQAVKGLDRKEEQLVMHVNLQVPVPEGVLLPFMWQQLAHGAALALEVDEGSTIDVAGLEYDAVQATPFQPVCQRSLSALCQRLSCRIEVVALTESEAAPRGEPKHSRHHYGPMTFDGRQDSVLGEERLRDGYGNANVQDARLFSGRSGFLQ